MANKEQKKKQENKIESKVFDRKTLLVLSKIMKKQIIDNIEYPISTGKEANVFLAVKNNKKYAVKIYKKETSKYKKKEQYLAFDKRTKKTKMNSLDSVSLFAKREFKHLLVCSKFKISAPIAYFQLENILIMQFCGEGNLPYPTLLNYKPKNMDSFYKKVIFNFKKMIKKAKIVHGDLSKYNILVGKNEKPIFIDFAQSISLNHINAKEYMNRDLTNINDYFFKQGVDIKKIDLDFIFEK